MESYDINNSKSVTFLFLTNPFALCALLLTLKAQDQLIYPKLDTVCPEFGRFFVVNDSRAKKSVL